jgi:hypothetical protein
MKVQGEYYIKARCIGDSYIAHASPCAREIWDYLLRKAAWCDQRYKGIALKRGQLLRSYQEIIDDLCWYSGCIKKTYTGDATDAAMRTLTDAGMVTRMRTVAGVLITICNYDKYQDPKTYGDGCGDGTD